MPTDALCDFCNDPRCVDSFDAPRFRLVVPALPRITMAQVRSVMDIGGKPSVWFWCAECDEHVRRRAIFGLAKRSVDVAQRRHGEVVLFDSVATALISIVFFALRDGLTGC